MPFALRVDEDMCMGAQRCTHLAPKTFAPTEDGLSTVTDASAITEDQAAMVARQCPYAAIVFDPGQG